MTAVISFTGKVLLERADQPPTCPWCDGLLDRIHWHKVRGGPPMSYCIVLSCHRCRAVLDCAASGGAEAA